MRGDVGGVGQGGVVAALGQWRPAVGTTTTVTVATAPVFKVPRLAMTLVAFVITIPCDELAENSVTPAGRTLVKATEEAVFGPLLVTVKV